MYAALATIGIQVGGQILSSAFSHHGPSAEEIEAQRRAAEAAAAAARQKQIMLYGGLALAGVVAYVMLRR